MGEPIISILGWRGTYSCKGLEITLITPDWEYKIDLLTQEGEKKPNQRRLLIEEYNQLSAAEKNKISEKFKKLGVSNALVIAIGGKVERSSKKILGYMCDKVTFMGIDSYFISNTNLDLTSKGKVMGMVDVDEEAILIKVGKVPGEKFLLPKNIEIKYDPEKESGVRKGAKVLISGLLKDETPDQVGASDEKSSNESDESLESAMKQMQILMQMMLEQQAKEQK